MVTNKRHVPSFILSAIASALFSVYLIYILLNDGFTYNADSSFISVSYINIYLLIQTVIPFLVYICFCVFFIVKKKRPVFILSIGLLIIFILNLADILNYYTNIFSFLYINSSIWQGLKSYTYLIEFDILSFILLIYPAILSLLTSILFALFSFFRKFKIPVIVILILNIVWQLYSLVSGLSHIFSIPDYFSFMGIILVAYQMLFYISLLVFTITLKKPLPDEQTQLSDNPVEYVYDIY